MSLKKIYPTQGLPLGFALGHPAVNANVAGNNGNNSGKAESFFILGAKISCVNFIPEREVVNYKSEILASTIYG